MITILIVHRQKSRRDYRIRQLRRLYHIPAQFKDEVTLSIFVIFNAFNNFYLFRFLSYNNYLL